MLHAEADFHDVRQAGFIIGEPLEEVANAESGGFAALVHALDIGRILTCFKGIIAKFN